MYVKVAGAMLPATSELIYDLFKVRRPFLSMTSFNRFPYLVSLHLNLWIETHGSKQRSQISTRIIVKKAATKLTFGCHPCVKSCSSPK